VFYSWRLESGAWVLYENGLAGDSDVNADTRKLLGRGTLVRLVQEATGLEWRHGDPAPAGFEPMTFPAVSPGGTPLQGWATYAVGKASVCSGDPGCYMRYGDKGVFYSDADPAVRYIPDQAQWQNRTAFCTDPHGTGVNAPGHRPQSRYGDAAPGRGNCAGQLLVNDRYSGQ